MVDRNIQTKCVISQLDQSMEEYASSLQGFDLDFRQLDSGRFRARTTIVDLQGVRLKRRSNSLRYALVGKLPDSLVFYFPLKNLDFFANGQLMTSQMQLVSSAGARVFSIVPESYDHLLIGVDQQEVRRVLPAADAEFFLQHAARIDLCLIEPQRKADLTRQLFDIYSALLYRQPAPGEADCANLRSEVIHLLLDYLRAHPDPQRVYAGTQERLLQRVLMHVESQTTSMPGLDELSHAVFASKRAIQYAFESIVGLSPMRYIKLHRLNLIRKELQLPGQHATISSIVSKYGFSNAGRMVREYTELFGERPRETVSRQLQDDAAISVVKKATS